MSKRIPGLYKRGQQGIWHIDKSVKGFGRIQESTGTSDLQEAGRYLTHRLEAIRKASVYGIRPERSSNICSPRVRLPASPLLPNAIRRPTPRSGSPGF